MENEQNMRNASQTMPIQQGNVKLGTVHTVMMVAQGSWTPYFKVYPDVGVCLGWENTR